MIRGIYLKTYSIHAFLLAFIFCGAIIGETVSQSLIVASLGSSVLSRLYLINGVLLLGLPLLFFTRIDKTDRGRLLSRQLFYTIAILSIALVLIFISSTYKLKWAKVFLAVLYPVSYLSKTILFLTFWTFANDLFSTSESKKVFPAIAAWGFGGGLAGACLARLLVTFSSAETLIILWILSY
ncbi:MAG: hypothetical protein GX640_14430, partial [Fibrobacter sp.]|nr:hypothetical protein [Fibrobacter sp.]